MSTASFEERVGRLPRLGHRRARSRTSCRTCRPGRRTSPSASRAMPATTRSRTSRRCGRTSATDGQRVPRATTTRVRGALAEDAFFQPLHAWHERHGLLCGFDQQTGARDGQPGRLGAALRRLRPHAPLVQRARLRPPRRRQDPLVAGPPLRPRARVDRVLPHLGLGRHAGGDVRLAAAVARRRREPLQPARHLLLDARAAGGSGRRPPPTGASRTGATTSPSPAPSRGCARR